MTEYSIEPRRRIFVKGYGLLSFARKYKKQLLGTGLDSLKTASKQVVHKVGEFLGNKVFLGNKITDTVTKSNNDKFLKEMNLLKKQLFHWKEETEC